MFNDGDFNCPIQGAKGNAVVLLSSLRNDGEPLTLLPSQVKGNMKYDMSSGTMVRTTDVSHLELLPVPSPKSINNHEQSGRILTITLPPKIWRSKPPNRYILIDYAKDADNGIFDYSHYGKTVFRPKKRWSERP